MRRRGVSRDTLELGDAVDFMRSIKRAIDPDNIMKS
jgi:hypothetical protein